MKKKLTVKEYVYVASMLFGLFFGAGNLIFPTAVGQLAGRNMWSAILGLLITGVGLPLLGVAALGLSRSDGLFALSSKVNRPYAYSSPARFISPSGHSSPFPAAPPFPLPSVWNRSFPRTAI